MIHAPLASIPAAAIARLGRVWRSSLAAWKTTVFLLKVMPNLPSRAIDWLTPQTAVERLRYPTHNGRVDGDLYRPTSDGPHPGIVMCLGVIPIDVDHPQIPRLGDALARSGFAALLYWSPAMRDRRLEPSDIDDIALAYEHLVDQPGVDPARSGLFGTCVGASFVLMAAASPRIRDKVGFVGTFAPYSSMWTLAPDIASSSRSNGNGREPWPVDPLTRAVYVRTFTDELDPAEAAWLREQEDHPGNQNGVWNPSDDGELVQHLLEPLTAEQAQSALARLPAGMQARLTAMSPVTYVENIRAPLVIISHDRDDNVIPVGESRRLRLAFNDRPGVNYTEFGMFQHADPTKRKLPAFKLIWELGKFYRTVYPMFRKSLGD